MDLSAMFLTVLALGLAAIVLRLVLARHRTKDAALRDGGPPPVRPDNEVLDRARERFRQGPTYHSHEADTPHRGTGGFRPSERSNRPALHLTPRTLSTINARRRASGRPGLNSKGFQTAIAVAPIRSTNQDDWLVYLIAYNVMFANHEGRTPETSITITPSAPYNGQGGEFSGAGASGSWPAGDPAPATIEPGSRAGMALGLAGAGAAVAGAAGLDPQWGGQGDPTGDHGAEPDPLSDPNSYKGSTDDLAPSRSEPAPSYSAPDPTPSYSAPEPSYSSSDTGGGGGGGDGGGGGGGGTD